MKLCFLAGANSIHSKRWIEYFADRGHQIHWISLTPNEVGHIKNTRFYQLKGYSSKVLDILFNLKKVRKLVKRINPDIFHAHYAGVSGVLGALSGFRPFILTAWGSDVLIAGNSKIKRPLVKFALNKADLITCDADHMKKAIERFGVSSPKIKIIYFGVDILKFSPGGKSKEIEKRLEISSCPVVMSLRNLEPVYNVETFLRAVPLVLKEISNTEFIIAGKGSEEKKLKNLVKNLKIEKNVNFIGFIPNDDLPRYLRTADIYVSTSLSDAGIASSTAEAIASGLPVVITDSGENRRWIKDGENGFIVPIKSPKILAEKIIYLLKDKNQRIKFGEKGRKIIRERNNYYKEMAKMEKIYEEIIKKYE